MSVSMKLTRLKVISASSASVRGLPHSSSYGLSGSSLALGLFIALLMTHLLVIEFFTIIALHLVNTLRRTEQADRAACCTVSVVSD